MEEDKRERSNIIKVGAVGLVIIGAIIVICKVLGMQREVTIILGSTAFLVFVVNAIYSNHIIKQVSNLDDKLSDFNIKINEKLDKLSFGKDKFEKSKKPK